MLLEYYVNGATIPLVNFDVGPSWSGLIPISSAANETRKVLETFSDDGFALLIPQLFFWFFPPGPEGSLDDLIFWYAVILVHIWLVCSSTGLPKGQTEVLVARRWRVPSKKTE